MFSHLQVFRYYVLVSNEPLGVFLPISHILCFQHAGCSIYFLNQIELLEAQQTHYLAS
jgi:hypothetical protein